MGYLRLALVALLLGVSTSYALGTCPAPPSGINYDTNAGMNYFQRWCQSIGGHPGQDLEHGISMGCFDCPANAQPSSVAGPVALFVGLPVMTGSLAMLMKLAGSNTSDPNATSDTEDPTAAYGKAFAIGAGVGLGGAIAGLGIMKMTQASKPVGLGFAGALLGAGAGAFNQSLQNDKKTAEQKKKDDDSGKTAEEYQSAALKGTAIGFVGGVITGLGVQRFSDFVKFPSAVRNNRWVRRTTVVSSPSFSGTRLGVVFR